ncbi:helix-turn-helix domain-containing protein (plasmid) [Vibrio pelagius]|uniref:Helix-turn-helix domain-containing protein n=1 Tax=Vibrio pelagius TaxID=28169 RepID=A0ABY5GAE0_VIBPE|nr:helix-turn-helix domain-containing protein [Vibrio pelagius]UTT87138.1 helix-turn-helix domain-containing protein [Vibrio pelagius]
MAKNFAISRASILKPFLTSVSDYNQNPELILTPFGLNQKLIDDSQLYLPSYCLGYALETASQLTNLNDIGLISGHKYERHDMHPLVLKSIEQSGSLLSCLLSVSQLQNLQGSHFHINVAYKNGGLGVVHRSALSKRDKGFLHSHMFTTSRLLTVLREFMGEKWKPDYLDFEPQFTATPMVYSLTKHAKVNTGQPSSFIPLGINVEEVMKEYLQSPTPVNFDKLEQVKKVTDSILLHEAFSMDYVSGLFGVSERTIQRLFTQKGESFRGYVNGLIVDKTQQLLSQGLSVEEISVILNYSDAAKLTRAIKNTTGLSPTQLKIKVNKSK